jgi:hypothetical protein
MSKPINVEAQRVHKLLSETCGKVYLLLNSLSDRIKVLALLNSEFFEEVSKKERDELGTLTISLLITAFS